VALFKLVRTRHSTSQALQEVPEDAPRSAELQRAIDCRELIRECTTLLAVLFDQNPDSAHTFLHLLRKFAGKTPPT
jgi:hypothetical protein